MFGRQAFLSSLLCMGLAHSYHAFGEAAVIPAHDIYDDMFPGDPLAIGMARLVAKAAKGDPVSIERLATPRYQSVLRDTVSDTAKVLVKQIKALNNILQESGEGSGSLVKEDFKKALSRFQNAQKMYEDGFRNLFDPKVSADIRAHAQKKVNMQVTITKIRSVSDPKKPVEYKVSYSGGDFWKISEATFKKLQEIGIDPGPSRTSSKRPNVGRITEYNFRANASQSEYFGGRAGSDDKAAKAVSTTNASSHVQDPGELGLKASAAYNPKSLDGHDSADLPRAQGIADPHHGISASAHGHGSDVTGTQAIIAAPDSTPTVANENEM